MSYCNTCHSYSPCNCATTCCTTTTSQCASPEDGCLSDTKLGCTHYSGDDLELCEGSITSADTGDEVIEKIVNCVNSIAEGQLDDKLVKISSGDTTSGYLFDKLKKKTGANVTLTRRLTGMNEFLEIDVPVTSETTFTGIDSDGIDYTAGGTAGHAPTYKVKIDPASDGELTVSSAGVKLLLADTYETDLTVTDTSTINLTAGGTHGHTLSADAIISAQSGNLLVDNTGLYVGATDTSTIDFATTGSGASLRLTAAVKISATANNQLSDDTGLYAAPYTSSNGITKTTNNFKLGGALIEDTIISGAYDLILSQGQLGVGVTPSYPLQVGTNTSSIGIQCTNAQQLSNSHVNYGIAGSYSMSSGSFTHSTPTGNVGVVGTFAIYTSGNHILNVNGVYSGVLGEIKGFSDYNNTTGTISSVAAITNLVNSGSYANIAGLHIHAPSSAPDTGLGEAEYDGTVTNSYSILIDEFAQGDFGDGVITNRYGIYQKGTDENVFFGSIIAGGSSYWKAPTWTTGGRPASPSAGMFGYNSSTGKFEGYAGGTWNNFF